MNHTKLSLSKIMVGLCFMLDRMSKYFVVNFIHKPIQVNNFLSIQKTFNRGIIAGLGNDSDSNIFFAVSGLVILVYAFICYQFFTQLKWQKSWAYALILGGGLSNIIDRFLYQGVVDFITLSCAGYSWPTFNIADMAITFGAIGILSAL